MKMQIVLDGVTYDSREMDLALPEFKSLGVNTLDEVVNIWYKNLSDMKKVKVFLSNGSTLLLGEAACQRAHWIFVP